MATSSQLRAPKVRGTSNGLGASVLDDAHVVPQCAGVSVGFVYFAPDAYSRFLFLSERLWI